MAQSKTTKEKPSTVPALIASVENERRRNDTQVVTDMMARVTGQEPALWGNMIGFDTYHYKYDSGREGDLYMVGLSPRKAALTVYIIPGFEPYEDLLSKLGKYKTGSSCLYINKLDDIDMDVLESIVERSYKDMLKQYPKS